MRVVRVVLDGGAGGGGVRPLRRGVEAAGKSSVVFFGLVTVANGVVASFRLFDGGLGLPGGDDDGGGTSNLGMWLLEGGFAGDDIAPFD